MLPRKSTLYNLIAALMFVFVCVTFVLMSLPTSSRRNKMTSELESQGIISRVDSLNVKSSGGERHVLETQINDLKLMSEPSSSVVARVTSDNTSNNGQDIYGRVLVKDLIKTLNEAKPPYSNPHDFKYIINQINLCGMQAKETVDILTYVHTSPDHYKRRMVIRDTWGGARHFKGLNNKIVFFCGATPNKQVQDALHLEADRFGDIVQEDFHDSYKNLTYKGIMALKWVSTYCNNTKYVLKTDDDIFVNIFSLTRYLHSMARRGVATTDLLLCHVWDAMKVMRDKKSKWYIPPEMYKDNFFSRYCSGSAYIMTTDVMKKMYEVSLTTPFFWVDDFYLTGLLPQRLNLMPMKFNSAYRFAQNPLDRFIGPKSDLAIFAHLHDLNKWQHIWKKLLEQEMARQSRSRSR